MDPISCAVAPRTKKRNPASRSAGHSRRFRAIRSPYDTQGRFGLRPGRRGPGSVGRGSDESGRRLASSTGPGDHGARMLLAALTGLTVLAWYVFVTSERLETAPNPDGPEASDTALPASCRIVLAGAGASGQIVLPCLAFGIAGLLTVDAVAVAAVLTAAGLLALGLRSRESRGRMAGRAMV